MDVSVAAILETKDRRIILVNGHIINVYHHTTSNPDKINWEELEPVLPCLSAEVEIYCNPERREGALYFYY